MATASDSSLRTLLLRLWCAGLSVAPPGSWSGLYL